jgi:hypothetical protein
VFGAVQQQTAAAMQQTVEAARFQVDVAQAAAEQVGALTADGWMDVRRIAGQQHWCCWSTRGRARSCQPKVKE